jgi:cell division protein FtsN
VSGIQTVKQQQRGSVIVGIIIGVVLGLAAALAVAVYVTKVPVPFLNKGAARSPEQDAAEIRKNQNWDPNAPLYGRNPARALPPPPGAVTPPQAGGSAPAQADARPPAAAGEPRSADPLGELAAARAGISPGSDPFIYFVQAGAFRSPEDAEAQRAKLSLMGIEARVSEREQSGRQVFRVRIGPFETKDQADGQKSRLDASGFETALVRVQR